MTYIKRGVVRVYVMYDIYKKRSSKRSSKSICNV